MDRLHMKPLWTVWLMVAESMVEHPKAFRCAGRNVAYVQSTRKSVDDIIAFLSEHEEELDSLDIVAADTALYQKN